MNQPSVRRQLLLAVAVPLVLFLALTVYVIDAVYRQLQESAMRDLLQEQVVALLSASDLDRNGHFVVNLVDPESRLDLPGSGHYAVVRSADGKLLWSSPSLAGTGLAMGAAHDPAAGNPDGIELRYQTARGGTRVVALERALQWEYDGGHTRKLIYVVAQSTATQDQQLQRFRRQMGVWFGMLAVVSLATMAWMLRRALAPVRRLEAEIEAVETGTAQRLGGGYPRELEGVTRGLNALLESERNRIARYRDTLGNLAHSLKTPLAVIRANLVSQNPEQAVQFEVDRIAQIVEHQLKRAAASGGVTLGQTAVPVLPMVTELRAAMLKVHARKDLQLDVDIPPDVGFLGDPADMLELLGNLVDNACKWCTSRVCVSAALQPTVAGARSLSVVVEDDGAGIAKTDRHRVLQRGVRADEHVPGHGLGLAMVRDTVGLYGGKLVIENSTRLKGARVEMQLPGKRCGQPP